jgi:hypothetical protein
MVIWSKILIDRRTDGKHTKRKVATTGGEGEYGEMIKRYRVY